VSTQTEAKQDKIQSEPKPDGIQLWLVVASIVVVVVVVVLANVVAIPVLSAVSNLVSLLLTFYVSYAITNHFAQKSSRADLRGQEESSKKELRNLAEASGEHIFLLSSQIRELAEETDSFDPDGDRSAIYLESLVSQMQKLASQAELSFHNMQRIAGLDISIPELRDEVRTTIEQGTRLENVSCPHCNDENQIALSLRANSTRHNRCSKCRKGFVLHRLPDGHAKVTFQDSFSIKCPNPGCNNEIFIRRKDSEWGIMIRNCFECFARVRYDLDRKEVEGYEIEKPLTQKQSAIVDGRGPCPYCSYSVVFKETKNDSGQQVQYCPNCTRLIVVEAPGTV
jgi:transposase-like protein